MDNPKPAARDTLAALREVLESSFLLEIGDFAQVADRIISQLLNWELLSEEYINISLEALQLLAGTHGVVALVAYGHCQALLDLLTSENIPEFLEAGIIRALGLGARKSKFKKEMVKLGVCKHLVHFLMSRDAAIQAVCIETLKNLSIHPSKKAYIPGETQDHN